MLKHKVLLVIMVISLLAGGFLIGFYTKQLADDKNANTISYNVDLGRNYCSWKNGQVYSTTAAIEHMVTITILRNYTNNFIQLAGSKSICAYPVK